jgi:predicted ATPase
MIKRIKARNFLSLKEMDVTLGPRNVLVGPNMSGKSNFIECMKFIQESTERQMGGEVSPLHQAISKRGGFNEIVWKGEPQGPVSLSLQVELPAPSAQKPISYTYDLVLKLGPYSAEVESERLAVETAGKTEILLENAGGKFKSVASGQMVEGPQNTLGLNVEHFGRYHPPSRGSQFLDFIAGWRFYHVVPALVREANPPKSEVSLSERGENLSSWLLTLQTYPADFLRITQACCDVFPGLSQILFQPVETRADRTAESKDGGSIESAKIAVGTGESHFRSPISLARMSDGELAFLALSSVILAPPELRPSVLCIEEPESHLHPRLIEVLMELLNQCATQAGAPQVIATTHSPLLVDRLKIEELLVVEKTKGATQFTRPSTKKHLKALLSRKEQSLGDLWYSGALSDS